MNKETYFESTEYKDVKELIKDSAKKFADRTAFILKHKNGKEVTYENILYPKFLEDINSFGTKLYNLGFKGKRVAIVGRNRYEWAVSHMANLVGGIVSVPLDKELQVDELESCLERSKVEVVIFDGKYIDKIKEIEMRGNTNLKHFICMDKINGYDNFWDLKEQGAKLIEQGQKDYAEWQQLQLNKQFNNEKCVIF